MRLLLDAVVDYGIFMLDTKGLVVSWNTGAERIKQYRADEVIGRHFSMFYLPHDVQRDWPSQELRRAESTGRYEEEGWRVRKDGSHFWANVVITPLRDPQGQLTGFGKVTRDLTERRKHENELRESEQLFRLLVEGVTDYAIFMLSPAGIIESWNSGAQVIKGYSAQEAIGRHFSTFYRPEDVKAGKPAAELASALEFGRVEDEGWRVRKDGSVFWANVVISAVYGADRRLRGFAKVTRDMTERRRLHELEKSGRRMSEFLAMLAHELRNPLAPIRNAVTVLQLEPAPSPLVRSSRDLIDRQLTHMTRLVDDLLDVGRMSTGKILLKSEQVVYNQVVARAVEAVKPLLDARHHHFNLLIPATDVLVRGDGTRLTQVLQNLLINAAKYTPEGGQIELAVSLHGTELRTSVRDNGAGLSPQAIERIFTLFAQGDELVAASEGGLGIGLTLARSLVEMHGGALKAESPGVGLGSTFSFFLPNAVAEKTEPGEPDESGKLRLLIVDDNRDAADSLAEILRLMGCAVKVAYNGADGLEFARSFSPQAVLMDLGMPTMSGYEAVKRMRAMPNGGQMLIAAVTGYGNEEDKGRTRDAGFDLHLVKPVEFASLQLFVERARGAASG